MAYDISGKASAKETSSKPAAPKNSADMVKIGVAVVLLAAGGYLGLAGNQGWAPFGTSVKPPDPISDSERQLMDTAPKKASEIPNIQKFEAMPENLRPVKAGS